MIFFFCFVSFYVILSLIFLSFVSRRSQHTNFCFPQFYSFTCFASLFLYCLSTCLIHSSVVLIFLHKFYSIRFMFVCNFARVSAIGSFSFFVCFFFVCEFFLFGFVMFVDSTEILKKTLILKGFRFTNENISIRIETQLKHFLILFLPLLIGIKFPLVIIVSHIFLSLDFACLSLWVGICCLLPSSLYTSLLFFSN